MNFETFASLIERRFNDLAGAGTLYEIQADKDEVYQKYLDAFPPGTNLVYKERTEYDCNTCQNFIRDVGRVVIILPDTTLATIWDVDADAEYAVVAEELSAFVRTQPIGDMLSVHQAKIGAQHTHQQLENGDVKKWAHFHCTAPERYVLNTPKDLANHRAAKDVFKRGVREIGQQAVTDVLELIEQGSLYRGAEFKRQLVSFAALQQEYLTTPESLADNYCWAHARAVGAYIRNSAIGTLLTDLSDGKGLEDAVKSFEAKVAPANYKRPTALITKSMVTRAVTQLRDLGVEPSLKRRFARASDLSINDILFVNRSTSGVVQDALLDSLMEEVSTPAPQVSEDVEEIEIDEFLATVVPEVSKIEVLLENRHTQNLVSIIAPQHEDSPSIFQWSGNNFSWSYHGNTTDSPLQAQVQAAGGRIDGALRFSHSWNADGKNQSLMDLHVFLPDSGYRHPGTAKEVHDDYPAGRRVGWNNRSDRRSGGVQDVDFTSAPGLSVPVENITFPDMARLPDGEYIFKIHNWQQRVPNKSGFVAEIALNGEVYEYDYPTPVGHKEWITVAHATLKDGHFTITHKLESATSSMEVWGLSTQEYHDVSILTMSPNHWDGQEVGNKHHFFLLEGCENPEEPRGIFNEFLDNRFTEHRKVFEVLGEKTKCARTSDQLSGLGFSSTKRDSVVVRVTGDRPRALKILF